MTEAEQPEAYLRSVERLGMKPGLERITALLDLLGNPQHAFRVVHVAGSNGKGSTAAFIAAALARAGLKVGLFSSPHLERYNERIRVNGTQISDVELGGLVERVRPLAERVAPHVGSPTEFELGTAMAFRHFADVGVDYAVIETGLGGRLDSTNVVDPVMVVITPITMDHTEILGSSLGAIAREKAGIIKTGRPVILAPQEPEAEEVLVTEAERLGAPVTRVVRAETLSAMGGAYAYRVVGWDAGGGSVEVHLPEGRSVSYHIGMIGPYQLQNAAVAATALHELARVEPRITQADIEYSLSTTRMPGRLETIAHSPTLIIDGAHNPLGARQLAMTLERLWSGRPITFVCGISKDKPAAEILRHLVPMAGQVITTQASSSRLGGWPPEELLAIVRSLGTNGTAVADATAALRTAHEITTTDGVVCVTGSLYLVGEVRSLFVRSEAVQGWGAIGGRDCDGPFRDCKTDHVP